ncbi:MAG: hypothetical protein ACRDRA_19310, partial [Pseudonocardiaceae bacterium]
MTLVEITDWVTRRRPYTPPHPDTIERVFSALGAQGLADQLGAYLGRQAGIGPVGAPLAAA